MPLSSAHLRAHGRFGAAGRLSALALVLAALATGPACAQAIRHAGDCRPSRDPRTPMPPDCQKRRQQAMDEAKAHDEVERARVKADEEGQVQAAHWREGAKPISREREEELEGQIRALLATLPAYGTPAEKYSKQALATLTDKLPPLLFPLAGSAYLQAQSIPAGAKGRAAFDQWDRGSGGRAVTILHAVAQRWPNDMRVGEPTRTMIKDNWGAYRDQMDDKGTLDPAFMARIQAGLPALRARQAAQAAPPERPRQVRTETQVLFLRPDEVTSYVIGHEIGKGAGEIAVGRAKLKTTFDGVESGLRTSREAFWKCYATRCTDPAPLYVAYSQYLQQKDHLIYLVANRDAAIRKTGGDDRMMDAYAKLMNTREIDGGPINGCENDYEGWRARIFQIVKETKLSDAFNPETGRRVAKAVFGGPEYAAVQTCRDKMEFALRPR